MLFASKETLKAQCAAAFRRSRAARGATYTEVARATQGKPATIRHIENAQTIPSLWVLLRYCDWADVTPDIMLGISEPPEEVVDLGSAAIHRLLRAWAIIPGSARLALIEEAERQASIVLIGGGEAKRMAAGWLGGVANGAY